eukprot:CAMPEP_0206228300 /NCGR_PEP_ID=MMETSP0047_2-20121206/9098_1 /ASSEMBLY_ACC=CAM_ASM_000192 /TAXON_ID=195065 /ORGANISM="Chroomonas mesostigmatica_cf, Strain CCMP1168" /LENGTH=1066 /DNA_ID=CAMNT_0053651539 /DNA_START=96 /DNA_END=3292 /DNA_ORIENTATION=+
MMGARAAIRASALLLLVLGHAASVCGVGLPLRAAILPATRTLGRASAPAAGLRLRGGGRDIEFQIQCKDTQPGQSVAVTGGSDGLGKWKKPLKMKPSPFPDWKVTAHISEEDTVEYKYCIINDDGKVEKWEGSSGHSNRKLVPEASAAKDGKFGDMPAHARPKPPSGGPPQQQEHHNVDLGHASFNVGGGNANKFDQAIIDGNNKAGSWRQKLEMVKNFFYDKGAADAAGFNMERPSTEHLASIAIYLHFLSTGQVACHDVGGHHRPCAHANLASAIDDALNKVPKDAANAYVMRKIRPLLPSYSSAYTAQVPLTRIRDIAHRSDIPKDMKDDIKHNLQNKLHRCAGPEDLVTAQRIWSKVEHGDYNSDFKHQMWIFMGELKEFFNAGGLDEKLQDLKTKNEPDAGAQALIDKFLHEKHNGDAEARLYAMGELRSYIHAFLAKTEHGEVAQRALLADVAIEQYAFVMLAEAAARIEGEAQGGGVNWKFVFSIASQALLNAQLSETVNPKEAAALVQEAQSLMADTSDLQRAKAWLDRALRACTSFSDAMQKLFLERVLPIGQGLGVDQHAASVFVEAEVRSNVLFQLSRILTASLKTAKHGLNAPPWTSLQPGKAVGKLAEYHSLQALVDSTGAGGEKLVVFLQHAEGDEDIPANVVGIVLAEELPLLSHLGVRARQQGVVFACSDGQGPFDGLKGGAKGLMGKQVQMDLDNNGNVKIAEATGGGSSGKAAAAAPSAASIVADFDDSVKKVVACADAKESTAGAKAAAAGEIEKIAQKAGFAAPLGCALPFGLMMQAAKPKWSEYLKLCDEFDGAASDGPQAEALAAKIRAFIKQEWKVDSSIVKDIQGKVPAGSRVMVRSSANCEDLQKMSGAGLYDSIANVNVDSADAISKAVSLVWQSLWTKRAAQSRKAAGMKHSTAVMGILVQHMIVPDLAFIGFSSNPITRDQDEVYIEMCVGMGETLASAGQPGTPYRFSYSKKTKKVNTLTLSSFSKALVAEGDGFELASKPIDFGTVRLHTDAAFRSALVSEIAVAIEAIADARGSAQDVEGAVDSEGGIHIVQARP